MLASVMTPEILTVASRGEADGGGAAGAGAGAAGRPHAAVNAVPNAIAVAARTREGRTESRRRTVGGAWSHEGASWRAKMRRAGRPRQTSVLPPVSSRRRREIARRDPN